MKIWIFLFVIIGAKRSNKIFLTITQSYSSSSITTKKGYQCWWAVVCEVNRKLNQQSSIRFEKENLTEEMIFKTIEVKEN